MFGLLWLLFNIDIGYFILKLTKPSNNFLYPHLNLTIFTLNPKNILSWQQKTKH